MSYNEVEQLRKSGNLADAYEMALSDLKLANEADPEDILTIQQENIESDTQDIENESLLTLSKRALAWVLYDYLKENSEKENFDTFMDYLKEFVEIELSDDEKMVVNQLVWVIGKAAFEFTKEPEFDVSRMEELLEVTMKLNFSKQTKGYSFLFKAFHKALKYSPKYLDFAVWWDLNSFIRDDYKYTKQDDGKKIMAIAEQGYNRYAKHLVRALSAETDEDSRYEIKQKIRHFLPSVEQAINRNKYYRKLPYYRVKLMLAIKDFRNAFTILKSLAHEKSDEFWVWDLMAEAYLENTSKQMACLCTALMCRVKSEKAMITRIKLIRLLINDEMYDEAKTEIAQVLRCCLEFKLDIPDEITEWGELPWYGTASVKENNNRFYESFRPITEEILYGDIPLRKVVVESVNTEKSILNFIGLDYDRGYFRYDKSSVKINLGDILLVRIKDAGMAGRYNLFSLEKLSDKYLEGILKHYTGEVIKPVNKSFGFVDGMFITSEVLDKYNLNDGEWITGKAMISYNKKKEEWGWKVISVDD